MKLCREAHLELNQRHRRTHRVLELGKRRRHQASLEKGRMFGVKMMILGVEEKVAVGETAEKVVMEAEVVGMVEVEVALMFPIGFRGTGQTGVDLAAALGWVKIGIDHYCEYITKQRISVPGSLSLEQSNSIQFFRHPKARCHPSRHSLHSTATHLSHSPTTISNCAYQTTPQPHLSQNLPQTLTYHNTQPPPPPQRTMSSPLSTRRLFHEYQLLCKHSPDGITAGPISEDDIFTWEALIPGPADTPYEGGVFVAEMKFPRDYPLSPPTMRFVGDVWHPNGNPPPPGSAPPSQKKKMAKS